jgi:hypothetical protein
MGKKKASKSKGARHGAPLQPVYLHRYRWAAVFIWGEREKAEKREKEVENDIFHMKFTGPNRGKRW